MSAIRGALGEQGFELITVFDKSSNWFTNMEKGFMLFKREIPPGTDPEGAWCVQVDSTGALKPLDGETHGYPERQAW